MTVLASLLPVGLVFITNEAAGHGFLAAESGRITF